MLPRESGHKRLCLDRQLARYFLNKMKLEEEFLNGTARRFYVQTHQLCHYKTPIWRHSVHMFLMTVFNKERLFH